MDIRKQLLSMQDLNYKAFSSKLMPTVNADTVIGVRIPMLRRFAKSIKKTPEAERFLKELPHKYFEENNLHAFLIEQITDFDECIKRLNEFLPYVDNWATCDSMRPKCFKDNTENLLREIKVWLGSGDAYTVRFGIEMLMIYFLDDKFDKEFLKIVADIKTNEYYVKMMIAWYFQTALYKQYESAIEFIEEKRLSCWVHNKAIQKSLESFKISDEKKAYLRTLRRE